MIINWKGTQLRAYLAHPKFSMCRYCAAVDATQCSALWIIRSRMRLQSWRNFVPLWFFWLVLISFDANIWILSLFHNGKDAFCKLLDPSGDPPKCNFLVPPSTTPENFTIFRIILLTDRIINAAKSIASLHLLKGEVIILWCIWLRCRSDFFKEASAGRYFSRIIFDWQKTLLLLSQKPRN